MENKFCIPEASSCLYGVLVPTFNNAGTLDAVISQLKLLRLPIFIVNDGSTDETSEILKKWKGKIQIAYFQANRGKGMAIQVGIKMAQEFGCTHLITIDSDGQHHPNEIPLLVVESRLHPDSIILGARNMEQPGIPGKSSFGNKFSNFWMRVETGWVLPDSQTGFRLYPLEKLQAMKWFSNRFEFEVEILVRAAWRGIQLRSVPVSVHYDPPALRISHFRPFSDFFRISILNTFLVPMALLWFRPKAAIKRIKEAGWKKIFLWGEMSRLRIAASIAIGVFLGIFPIWGYQMAAALGIAWWLKLHKPTVLLFANISIPPFIPFILYLSLKMGEKIVTNPESFQFSNLNLESVRTYAIQYFMGAVALAILAGIFVFIVSFIILILCRTKKRGRPINS